MLLAMSAMDGEHPGDGTGESSKIFGTKPYLDKRGREILNRAARQIQREEPEWCDEPNNPSTSDCLVQIQQGNGGRTDTGMIIDLLGKGLTAEETIVWVLWRHSALKPREIFYAYEGKDHPGRSGIDDQAVRNIQSRIRAAAMKLGVNVDLDGGA